MSLCCSAMWVYLSSFFLSLSLSVIIYKQFLFPFSSVQFSKRSPLSSLSLSQVISIPSLSVSVHHLPPLHVSIFPLQSHGPVFSSVSSTKGGSCYVNLLFSSSSIDYSTELILTHTYCYTNACTYSTLTLTIM